jgi:UDP-N-acetyl-D-glucosamine dehydrogenase
MLQLMQSTASRTGKKSRAQLSRAPLARDTDIVVIGLGYVGLPLAVLAASRGYSVRGLDIDMEKVRKLKKREADFLSPEEHEDFRNVASMDIRADESVLEGADAYLICVPTPVHDNRLPDLRPLKGAAEAVGRHISKGALVVIESTVSPGVCERVALPTIERWSGLIAGTDFNFAHCPERINPGDSKWSTRTIPRVVGGLTPRCLSRAMALYERITDAPLHAMGSIKEAEAVKMVENAFRDVNIAFVNELAMSFDRAGIDLYNVLEGASTKPFGFVKYSPGCGVGGHCIPVDPYYLIRYGRENGFEHRFLQTARSINGGMPRYTVGILERTLREGGMRLSDATVALLGLSYKKGITDMRESPAVAIQKELAKSGAAVRSYDPYVLSQSSVKSLDDALDGADAVILATDHDEFCSLSPEDFERHGVPIVVDGRNCLDKDAFLAHGITYHGIGR